MTQVNEQSADYEKINRCLSVDLLHLKLCTVYMKFNIAA